MKINGKKLFVARSILFFAAVYNLVWGLWVSIFPECILFETPASPFLLVILQCIGMLVGVYGIAYWLASQDPVRNWALVLVGLIGKVLGPIGAAVAIFKGTLPSEFFFVNIGNDLIWLMPFGWILYEVYRGGFVQDDSQSGSSLYQRLLGPHFNKLAPNLHHFHRANDPIKVAGHFQVWRGSSVFTRWLGEVARLPSQMNKVAVNLFVEQKDGDEIWHRSIGNHKVISKQWLSQGSLVEKFGPIRIYLEAKVQAGQLLISDHSATLWGIPFPPFFTPWVNAQGKDEDKGVLVTVEIGFYPFGSIIRYHGLVIEVPI